MAMDEATADRAAAQVAPTVQHQQPGIRTAAGPGRWHGVDVMAYKQDDAAPFRAVTRQVLFADPRLACEWRYFEVAKDGYSTLERHDHVHAVMIHRGRGQCLVGRHIGDVAVGDLVFIPPLTWHQFRANAGDMLGFLCLVNAERDRPQLPGEEDLAALRQDSDVASFIRC
ncbi:MULTISPECIES: cupin domain-containing protein [Rhodopseudomonas]|uniref:Cupin n=1 Tax=Rhodopseudomonas palustris TaxID=1076 RepID=A0A0D7F531_RHOPL|nr:MULTISPECIES: cupin domain-containing protein [Rhodopseudomonas]KIZ47910.1 cupin [Rhodopseudomonas palustris]MDF3813623.1 cupin domain-containing protein [Rhodopseudomonas sp. BAL398]WOK17023.1 cupin domain-containing protein [Rhodopseudomonas sp. BAL398]